PKTPEELLAYLPREYLDFSHTTAAGALADGTFCAVFLEILSEPAIFSFHGTTVVSARARTEDGAELSLKWFNQPYRRAQVRRGARLCAAGRVSMKKGLSLVNPSLSDKLPGILPVYASMRGLSQSTLRGAISAALRENWDRLPETLPAAMLSRYSLCTRKLALWHAHFPASLELLRVARRRLAFEDALLYQLAVHEQILDRRRGGGIVFQIDGLRERFIKTLPFSMTGAQLRALDALDADLQSASPMNRLLQGDVGSGKTVVALYALFAAAENGYQGALLAPTEILARQHFEQAQTLFGKAAVLLTGGMRAAERREAIGRIESGDALCVTGTHALLRENLRFRRLGLVVTDEQHRFGVRQRAAIEEKGLRPDVLVMSATPIPRTLSLLLHGDLDVTVLDELPPGRKPVVTRWIPERRREDLYAYLARQAQRGVQSFVVCPFIDEPEMLDARCVTGHYRWLRQRFPDVRAAMLHGRMKEAQKERVMRAFVAGELDMLVSTTLIEVGLHVPNAGVMVIENAERFGLAELHQLRGRVGRGEAQSYCFFLSEDRGEAAVKRLGTLIQSNDGFHIAEQDRKLRGPGDYFGRRQHGDAGPAIDDACMEEAGRAAKELLATPDVESEALIARAMESFGASLRHIAMN
ncbi:MAG: ATP-dependent DNA helicase RecG, partial [Clostridia bacterium]|nr:ATP-dependent DNA helicase RecG [Clostridia bacterium]